MKNYKTHSTFCETEMHVTSITSHSGICVYAMLTSLFLISIGIGQCAVKYIEWFLHEQFILSDKK